jgi:signal transduction histidine kinase
VAKILVVDDEEILDSLKRYFEVDAGWTVYAATNADDAIKIVQSCGDELDGIILDRNMPDESGHLAYTGDRVVRWLFDRDLLNRICLIMLTGYADVEIARMALSMGGWHFLEKNVTPEEIYKLLAPGIARKRSYRLRRWMLSGPDIEAVVDRIQTIIQQTLAPDLFQVYILVDGLSRSLTDSLRADPERRFVEHVLHHQSYLYAGSRKESQEWEAIDRSTGTLLAVRVEAYEQAESIGVMVMESHEEGAFDPRWQEVLSYLADLVGVSLTIGRVWKQKLQAQKETMLALQKAQKAFAEQESLQLLNKELKHRLATSVGTMLQYTESLECDLQDVPHALGKVKTAKRHLDSVIQVMKELGEVSQPNDADANVEVIDACSMVEVVLKEKLADTGFSYSIEKPDVCIELTGDRRNLYYCLDCIVQNAIEALIENRPPATPDERTFPEIVREVKEQAAGGDHPGPVEDISITVRKCPETGLGEIRIKDLGVGFHDEIKKRLFNPLFTTKLAKTDRGIGLYSVRRLITAMKGSVDARSIGERKGAEFVIRLPLAGSRGER